MYLYIEREIAYFFVSSFNSINKMGLYSAIIFLHCSFSISKLHVWLHVPLCSRWCAIILTVITWPSACHSPALGSSSTLWLLVGTIRNVRGPMMQSPITPVCWKMSSLLSTASQVPSHYRVNRYMSRHCNFDSSNLFTLIRKAFGSTLTSFHIKDAARLAFSIKIHMYALYQNCICRYPFAFSIKIVMICLIINIFCRYPCPNRAWSKDLP